MQTAEQTTQMVPEHEIAMRSQTIQEQTKDLKVVDLDTANQAGTVVGMVGELRKKIAEVFDPIINAAHLTHKKAIEKKTQFDGPLKILEGALKRQIGDWKLAEDRKRETERLQREAEARKQHEDLVVAVAAEVEKSDGSAAAEEILKEADNVPPVVMEKQIIADVTIRAVWKAEVTDLRALVKAVAEGKAPLAAIEANLSFLNKQAGSLKAEMAYPGVRVYEDRQVGKR